MNDRRRLELERLFDGESPDGGLADVVGGPGAAPYLEELRALRRLANRHDPSADARLGPPARPTIPPASARGRRWGPRAAVAAGVAALVGWLAMRGPGEARAPSAIGPAVATRPIARTIIAGRESAEVAWYRWANREPRRPEGAGRALWRSAGRRRGPALEVLTLELVNAPPGSAGRLQRAAAVRVASPGGRSKPDHRHHAARDAERPS